MTLRKKDYIERIIDNSIEENLKIFGAISIEGPKWCGKTWTSLNHSNSAVFLNNVNNNFNDRKLALIDVNLILDKDKPQLIDEWQEVPAIWDGIRYKCDEDKEKGKYILTGSATPVSFDIHHSGAGRICRMKMYTMSLFESGNSSGEVSLKELFYGNVKPIITKEVTLQDLIEYILKGGWPECISMNAEDAQKITKSYIDSVLKFDIKSIDGVNRDAEKMKLVLRSLARNETTITKDATILKDVSDSLALNSLNTLMDYLSVLEKLNLIENQKPFSVNLRSSARVGKKVKRHFTDPSLTCAILELSSEKMINDLNFTGFLFEALCERDLRIYSESLGGALYHFKSSEIDLEVDAIVELGNGDYGAIEIKLGTNGIEQGASNLLQYYDLALKKPKFLCIICGLANAIYKRPDGIYVVPITSLKP